MNLPSIKQEKDIEYYKSLVERMSPYVQKCYDEGRVELLGEDTKKLLDELK